MKDEQPYMSEYDVEIERLTKELNEMYRREGEAGYMIFIKGGGFILPVLLIPLFIFMITKKGLTLYGVAGVLLSFIIITAAILGKRYRDKKIDRLEKAIIVLREKKKQEELKYTRFFKDSPDDFQ